MGSTRSAGGAIRCANCGYSLGCGQDPCPECGTPLERHGAIVARRRRVAIVAALWIGMALALVVPLALPRLGAPLSLDAWLIVELSCFGVAGVVGGTLAAMGTPARPLGRTIALVTGFVVTVAAIAVLHVAAAFVLPSS